MQINFAAKVKKKLIVAPIYMSNRCICNVCGMYIPKGMPRITTTPTLKKDIWGAHICALCVADIARHITSTYKRKIGREAWKTLKDARQINNWLDGL